MSTDTTLQIRVPAPLPAEAPGSWISRLTLSQGCSLREMLTFLDLPSQGDLDLALHGPALAELRRKCSLPPAAFAVADRVITRVVQASLGDEVLHMDIGGKPLYRYCPLCLKEGSPPVFQIYWRFLDWRYCPAHSCLMESNCRDCGHALHYPRDMEASSAGRNGHGSQSRCQRCACDLAAAIPCLLDPRRMGGLSRLESHWLHAGRALVAALAAPLPATREGANPSLRRALEIDGLPTAHQAHAFERVIRAMHGPGKSPRRSQSRYHATARRNWGARIFPFAGGLDQAPVPREAQEIGRRRKDPASEVPAPKAPKRAGRPPRPRALSTIVSACCDRCGAPAQSSAEAGLNSFLHIGFDVGRPSVNGHGTRFDVALCHDCLAETLGPWLRLSRSDWKRLQPEGPPASSSPDVDPDG